MTMTTAPPQADPMSLTGVTTDAGAITAARHRSEPDSLWVCDLSQVWGGTCWLYFAYVLDHGSGRCLSWSPHRVLHGELITDALLQATTQRRDRLHSGAGAAEAGLGRRFVSAGDEVPVVFGRRCRTAEIDFPQWAIPSAVDVATCDAFLAGIRHLAGEQELTEDRAWASLPEARGAITAWIEDTYNRNPERLPTAVGTPG